MNSWTTFVTDCSLASHSSKFCKPAHMDQIFLHADGLGKRQAQSRTVKIDGHDVLRWSVEEEEKEEAMVKKAAKAVQAKQEAKVRACPMHAVCPLATSPIFPMQV